MLEEQDKLEGEENSGDIYPNATVKISKEQFSIYELKRQHEKYTTLVIAPPFQRGNVWKTQQKSELIESILMGIPIPMMYFFEDKEGKRQVVDGRQRLTTVFYFLNNQFSLKNLKILPEQNGKYFKELEPILQSTVERCQLFIYVIQPPTPEKIKFDIFDRVNRGGTSLNEQEMRNALYQGKATELLNRLVKLGCFQQATGYGINSNRMKDKYVVLRFLSFYMLHQNWLDKIEYKSDIDDFLAKTMKFINALSDEKIAQLENVFITAMTNSYEMLGENGFRFVKKDKLRPINMALFEVIAYFFSQVKLAEMAPDLLQKEVESLKQKWDADGTFNQMDKSAVTHRFNQVEALRDKLLS